MGRRKRKSKKKTHVTVMDDGLDQKVSKSFVFRRGKVGHTVINLVEDMRKVMSPYTALKLSESKKNTLKDFTSVAPTLGVTHFLIFSQTNLGTNLRMTRVPRGPTLTFRVKHYSLMKDIHKMHKRPYSVTSELGFSPLVVLNNFSGAEEHKRLMAAMFQNLFPPLDVQNIKLHECRRVVLLNLDPKTQEISFRHYVITASPVGLSKNIKKIIKAKVPDMGDLEDISQYVYNTETMSDSEVEDGPDNRLTLAQDYAGRGNKRAGKSAIRLKELGPRMTLQLLKIQEGFCDGRVMYHSYIKKTKEEQDKLVLRKKRAAALKKKRREEQEANLARKEAKRTSKRGSRYNDDDDDDDDDAVNAADYDDSDSDSDNVGFGNEGSDIDDDDDDGDVADQDFDDNDDDSDLFDPTANNDRKQKQQTKTKKNFDYSNIDNDDLDDEDYYRMEVGEEPAEGTFPSYKHSAAAAAADDDDDDDEEKKKKKKQQQKKKRLGAHMGRLERFIVSDNKKDKNKNNNNTDKKNKHKRQRVSGGKKFSGFRKDDDSQNWGNRFEGQALSNKAGGGGRGRNSKRNSKKKGGSKRRR